MPDNKNPWVKELLSWRGDDLGGVRVPFYGGGNQEIAIVETPLIRKLRSLAEGLAEGRPDLPRLIFLIGGPGNGKSHAVEEFLGRLGYHLGIEDCLTETLEEKFSPADVVPRIVEVEGGELEKEGDFREKIGRLVVIHDASATNVPDQDAAELLVQELKDLEGASERCLFVCCINRGVLARAVSSATDESEDSVAEFLYKLVKVSSLTPTEDGKWPDCWPLDGEKGHLGAKVACWPMDAASLVGASASNYSGELSANPVGQILQQAVDEQEWEVEGRCADCASRGLCPLRQNAEWLRGEERRQAFLQLLRLTELVSRQRWNFRNIFTLLVEALVGSWGEFEASEHPCEWVHLHRRRINDTTGDLAESIESAVRLTYRLYPHALFANSDANTAKDVQGGPARRKDREHSAFLLGEEWETRQRNSYVGEFLETEVIPHMDPASHTPRGRDDELRVIEDNYSRSIELGNESWPSDTPPAGAEETLLTDILNADQEWDALERSSGQASRAKAALRRSAARVAKRSVGVRKGRQGGAEYLDDYRALIHDEEALDDLAYELIDLFGHDRELVFDAVSTYGQARKADEQLLLIQSRFPLESIVPAPTEADSRPAHDLPFLRIAGEHLPVTYDLYRALRLREAGAPPGSLPSGVEAVMDRIKHIHAGRICRQDQEFKTRAAEYVISGVGALYPSNGGGVRFRRNK